MKKENSNNNYYDDVAFLFQIRDYYIYQNTIDKLYGMTQDKNKYPHCAYKYLHSMLALKNI